MAKIMPQEMEVWYLIPALRREISKILIEEYNFTQKKTAEFLGITESAVSQYLKSKRGKQIKFSQEELKKIKKCAKKIVTKNEEVMQNIYELCVSLRKSKTICNLHKIHDKDLPKDCEICFRNKR